MILVLLFAAAVSTALGEVQDALVIAAIVLLNAAIGFAQAYRIKRAIAALRSMATPSSRVRRGGENQDLPSHQVVPGDVLLLEAGNIIAADLRLIDGAHLRAAEAALTGGEFAFFRQRCIHPWRRARLLPARRPATSCNKSGISHDAFDPAPR